MKTTAIVFDKANSVILDELQLPDPTPRDLVVQNLVSGVSVGTERWAYLGKRDELTFPNVPGYMGIGRILEVGKEAQQRGYLPGQVVNYMVGRLNAPHGPNSWMATHLSHAIVDACIDPDGGFNIHRCERVPDGLDPFDASLAGLCAVALRGIEMARIPAGSTVLVVGLGVIGQYAAQICRLKGAMVAAADVDDQRLQIAAANGAEWTIHSRRENLKDRFTQIAPQGFDIIIDTSSIPAVVNSVMPYLKLYGQFIFQGWYPPPSALDLNAFHMRMPTCYFPCAFSGSAVATSMRWAKDGNITTGNLITHRPRPQDAKQIYEMIARGSEGFLGIVFDWRQ
ncbi:MAG: zinc-binding alcohol dehydrogenase [Phycisphaerales bacterium]|jgi:3-hydroxyethyl bacteriochlorophyllide a dehydrogenase|nr:zinc-binding alcohol dehydrogenase [Phycisphaerales bacterium]